MKLAHEINKMCKSGDNLFCLLNSRELAVVNSSTKTVDLRVDFPDHTIISILATDNLFFFGDTSSCIYYMTHEEMKKEEEVRTKRRRNPNALPPGVCALTTRRLLGHEGWVLAMECLGNYLYSCSDDKTIKVWDVEKGILRDELIGHKNSVCCLTLANDYLYSGSFDLTIRSWNLEEMEARLAIRDRLILEEAYSLKAETYKAYIDAKKKKRKRKGKGRGKSGGKSVGKKRRLKSVKKK